MDADTGTPDRAALRLYAIGIDEVRDLVGADPITAARVRALTAELIDPPAPRRGFLARLLGERTPTPAPPTNQPLPEAPTPQDVETVITGRYAPPDRAAACWAILEHVVARIAWGHHHLDLDAKGVADFDFALASAGVPAERCLGRLLRAEASIPVTPAAGLHAAYLPHAAVSDTGALLHGLDLTSSATATMAEELAAFLDRLREWAEAAERAGRPVPDLVAFHRTD